MNLQEPIELVSIDDFESYFSRFQDIFTLLINDATLANSQKTSHRTLLDDLYLANKVLSQYSQMPNRSDNIRIELGSFLRMIDSVLEDSGTHALEEIALALDLFLRNIGVRSRLVVENAHGKTEILLHLK